MKIRKAVFKGSWYPSGAASCRKAIDGFLEARDEDIPAGAPVGGIVPHAGWYYSGKTACRVIHALSSHPHPEVIFIFGMHLSPGSTRYLMRDGAWETPLGPVPIASDVANEIAEAFEFTIEASGRYTQDNTIELQLPFIKHFFPDAEIVPMGLPPEIESIRVAETAVNIALRQKHTARVIGSTDLTHYGVQYGFTPKGTGPAAVEWVRKENDQMMIDAMLSMDAERVLDTANRRQNACCAGAVAAAISAAKFLGADQARLLSYTTSHDKNPGDSLVGYAGIVFASSVRGK